MSLGAGAYKVGRARECSCMWEVSLATLQVPPPDPPPPALPIQTFTSIGGGASKQEEMGPLTPTLIINIFFVVCLTHYVSSKA